MVNIQGVFRRRVGPVRAWMVAAAVVLLTTGALATAGVQSSYGATTGGAQGSGAHPGFGARLDHVFIIMLENHAADHVIGDPAAPYMTYLANTYGQATDYFGVTHTSEPNYIAATSGSTWDSNNDNGWYTQNAYPPGQYPHTNIVDELEAAHIPWDAYMQAMPSAGYLGDSWPSSSNAL
ncbi:MAG: alkaline phosphatase family protein, partial [Streptosporangiaceae bacterium]